jgi:hypothetical protein
MTIVKEAVRPGHPAAAACQLTLRQEREAKPEGHADGAYCFTATEELVMRAHKQVFALGVFADQVRSRRESLDVVRR